MDLKKPLNTLLAISLVGALSVPVQAAEFSANEGRGWTYNHVMGEIYDSTPDTQGRRGELPIGTPSFSRKVRLPRVQKREEGTGIHAGPVYIHPAYTQSFEFDDNIRLQRDDEDRDGIFRELPAVTAEIQNEKFRAAGGYGMEIVNYVDNHDENSINHFAHGIMEYQFTDLRVSVEDTFSKVQSRASNANSIRDDVASNAVQVLAKYDRPRYAVEPGWVHNTVNHDAVTLDDLDYNEDIFSLLTGYKITDLTLLLLQNDAGITYYGRKTVNSDQAYWQILGGFRGEYITNISMEAKAGFQARRADNIPTQVEQKDYNGLVADVNVSWKISERDAFSFDYIRNVRNSTFQNNSYVNVDRASVAYSKRFFEKWILTPEFAWQLNHYPHSVTVQGEDDRRNDHFWETGVSLRYQVQEWLSAGVGYYFRNRASNFSAFDYNNNRVVCDISLAY